jgi:hypothetical protein
MIFTAFSRIIKQNIKSSKLLVFLFLIVSFQTINAQYTEIINSKRPGFSESPYGVGKKVFQVETGFFYQKNQVLSTFSKDNIFGTNVFLRYGNFLEKLEFNLDFTYQKEHRVFQNILTNSTNVSGISKLTFGAKYLVYNSKYTDKSKEIRSWKKRTAFDLKRLIPSVGVYLGLNTNILGKDFKEEGMSPKAAILLQNDISGRFVVLTNIIADKIGKKNSEFGYILTATYALTEKWSIFGEQQGAFKKLANNEFQFGGGAAYLYNNNMQFDISARTIFVGGNSSFYAGLGGSWRLDKHVNKKKSGDALEGTKEGFFKRIFKKNKNKKRKVKKVKIKKRRNKKVKKGTPSFYKKKKKKK